MLVLIHERSTTICHIMISIYMYGLIQIHDGVIVHNGQGNLDQEWKCMSWGFYSWLWMYGDEWWDISCWQKRESTTREWLKESLPLLGVCSLFLCHHHIHMPFLSSQSRRVHTAALSYYHSRYVKLFLASSWIGYK